MTTDELIEHAVNVLAQYQCKHLSWGATVWELAQFEMPANAIVLLTEYEDQQRR